MARAKRTERADARRRYRGTQAEVADEAGDVAAASTAASRDRGRPAVPARDAAPIPPQRPPSFTGAFRAAARPLNIREDIAYLPQLIRHRSVWIPVLASLVIGVLWAVTGNSNQIVFLAAQIFVVPPPMAATFLAGLLAPRASYLAGGLTGTWAALVFSGVILSSGATVFPESPAEQRTALALYGLAISPLFGLAVGGFAGYYRRFLAVSSPARRRPPEGSRTRGPNRPAPRRR